MTEKKLEGEKSFAFKMSVMAGSLAALTFPEAADASIVYINDRPISVTPQTNGFVDWDIDGDGIPETALFGRTTGYNTSYPYTAMHIESWTNGSIIGTYSYFFNLPTSYVVSANKSFTYTHFSHTYNSSFYSASGFQNGQPGYIGFQFEKDGQNLFGWAEITITLGESTVISEWAYDDMGNSIHIPDTVASTPESDNVAGLALLGMGAAGIRTWRKRKQRKLAEDSEAA